MIPILPRCSACPHIRPPIPFTGPTPCRVMFLGEAGARTEDEQRTPFVGKTGQELDNLYLPLCGLPRDSVFIANAMRCSHKDYHNPTPEEALSCASVHLGETLSRVRPQILVAMGAVACSLFGVTDMISEHGIPRHAKWGAWEGTLIPFYHPAAGLRPGATGFMIALTRDFYELGLLLRQDRIEYPSDPYPNPDYRICRTPADLDDYLSSAPTLDGLITLGEDTESLPDGSPFCVTISHTFGTGRLIYVSDAPTLSRYREIRNRARIHTVFHNYLHDVEVYDQLSLPIQYSILNLTTYEFTDTMVRAYNLCLGGGGDDEAESRAGRGSLSLKILAYRHLAMRMTSFKDTVYPHSVPKVLDWLWQAEELLRPEDRKIKRCECGHIQTSHEERGKTTKRRSGPCLVCAECAKYKNAPPPKPTPEEKALSQLHLKITNLIQSLESGEDVDPWKRMKSWPDEDSPLSVWAVGELHQAMGAAPVPSIAHVPEAKMVWYACRDADSALRLNLFLDEYKPWIWLD